MSEREERRLISVNQMWLALTPLFAARIISAKVHGIYCALAKGILRICIIDHELFL
jgi:hypothetical protein